MAHKPAEKPSSALEAAAAASSLKEQQARESKSRQKTHLSPKQKDVCPHCEGILDLGEKSVENVHELIKEDEKSQ